MLSRLKSISAAAWLAGLGAFLLVAAAAVFLAVRWDGLGLGAKTAVVGGLTAGVLLAGARLRPRLPATASVLVHLGTFLLPIDLAALALETGLARGPLLIAEGLLLVTVFPILARTTDSRLLRAAAVLGVPVLASGIGLEAGLYPPVLIAGTAAVLAFAARTLAGDTRGRLQLAGAALGVVAVFGPLLLVAVEPAVAAPATPALSLWSSSGLLVTLTASLLAAGALATIASARSDRRLALLALVTVPTGFVTLLADGDLTRAATVLQPAALFVLAEVAALLAVDDDLWGRPTAWLAAAAETVAVLAIPTALWRLLAPPELWDPGTDQVAAAAWGLVSVSWVLVAFRRDAFGDWISARHLAGAGAALAAGAAAIWLVGGPVAPGIVVAVGALALALLPSRRAGLLPVLLLAGLTLAATADHTIAALSGAPVAGLALVLAGRAWSSDSDRDDAVAMLTTLVAILIAWVGPFTALEDLGTRDAALLAVAVGGALVQGTRTGTPRTAGTLLLVVVPLTLLGTPGEVQAPVAALTAAIVAARTIVDRQPALGVVAVLLALQSAAAIGPTPFYSALTGLGVATAVAGARLDRDWITHAGGVLAVAGVWGLLSTAEVETPEAYTSPAALYALIAGLRARREDAVSSWIAYVPAMLLVALPALAVRLDDGPGWHALVAGTVAIAGVLAGGWRRLLGPLLTGTVLIVAVVLHETLAVIVAVPTWAWLAGGGSLLLGAGVALERSGLSAQESGRRLVTNLRDSFE